MQLEVFWSIVFILYVLTLFYKSKNACLTMLLIFVTTYTVGWSDLYIKIGVAVTYLWAIILPDVHYPEKKFDDKWRQYYKKQYEYKVRRMEKRFASDKAAEAMKKDEMGS